MVKAKATLAAAATLLGFAAAAQTAHYPDKPARIVVPYGAGGGVDQFTRPIAQKLSEQLGQQFIIDNKPGAGGTIGVSFVARAAPDGYTLLGGGVHQPMSENLYPKRGYDFGRDFVPVAITASVPNVLLVHPKVPFRTVKDLVAYAKANPNKLTYCSAGSGTAPHVIAELFKLEAGVQIVHVPHTGTAASYITFLGGNCDINFDGLGTAAQHIKSGKVIPLALTTAKRSAFMPDVPTMTEAGGPPLDAGTWYGMWAPANTPRDILVKLNREVTKALGSPEVKAIWNTQGADVPSFEFDQLQPYVRAEVARWTAIQQKAGIRAD